MDIALAVEYILPAAAYRGSVTANTQSAWEAVVWADKRRGKPTWEELEAATPPAPTLEEIIQSYETNIQNRLDDFAQTLTYDGMLSACTYATSSVDMYRIEGQYCVDARDATWAKAYALLSSILPTVQAGGEIPAWEDIEAELPPLAWPEGSRGCAHYSN